MGDGGGEGDGGRLGCFHPGRFGGDGNGGDGGDSGVLRAPKREELRRPALK